MEGTSSYQAVTAEPADLRLLILSLGLNSKLLLFLLCCVVLLYFVNEIKVNLFGPTSG